MSGTLFLVPTPIGNLDDITLRSLEVLKTADIIAAEDTRHSGRLLSHYDIKKPLISYHEHNESQRIAKLLEFLQEGKNVALISDAGTPTLSDPGYKLVREVIKHGILVDSLPGASSILVGLTISGLPTDKFYFGGFLPKSSTKRKSIFNELAKLQGTLIFFESSYRIAGTLKDAYEALGNRDIVIARELTKLHQEAIRTNLDEAIVNLNSKKLKGEIVLLIDREK